MEQPASNARAILWVMLLAAWPFFLWQAVCLSLHRPMPRLGRYLSVGPVEIMRDGKVDPVALKRAIILLAVEFLIFAGITIYAYINSSYHRRDN